MNCFELLCVAMNGFAVLRSIANCRSLLCMAVNCYALLCIDLLGCGLHVHFNGFALSCYELLCVAMQYCECSALLWIVRIALCVALLCFALHCCALRRLAVNVCGLL